MYPSFNQRSPNYPTRPTRRSGSPLQFPEDIEVASSGIYTQIEFIDYQVGLQGTGANKTPSRGKGLMLPIPRKINDVTTLSWDDISLRSEIAGLAGGVSTAVQTATNIAQVGAGATVNPFLFMMFQKPNYKEYTLSWSLAPRNKRESQVVTNIINSFKSASLPINRGVYLDWPSIAIIKFHPNDMNNALLMKPAAIQSVSVDYMGAGMPSFFNDDSKAPTVVNLNVHFKEIQFHDKADYGGVNATNLASRLADGATQIKDMFSSGIGRLF